MPGPVVNGVKVSRSASGEAAHQMAESHPFLPVLSEGTIRVVLLTSGLLVVARLRQTTDPDGDRAYQLIRPMRLVGDLDGDEWSLHPFLAGLTPQRNIVMLKAAVAAVLEPEARILQVYTRSTNQECPPSETPVERLKKAFQEFTDSIETG